MEITIDKLEDWRKVVEQIFPKLKGHIILLKGDLGAGKTTFTQYLLRYLECEDEVSSPTYSIVNEYETKLGKIFHFDLYRLKNKDEVEQIGMHEYLENSYLCLIEWPQVYEDILKEYPFHEIEIEGIEGNRKIIFN